MHGDQEELIRLQTGARMGVISKVFILIYVVYQNLFAGSAQTVTIPFQSISVTSKNQQSAPCIANTYTPVSLPPVQTQGSQNIGQNYPVAGQRPPESGPNCQNSQPPVAQNLEQNLQQTLGQPCSQSVTSQGQPYQSLSQHSSLAVSRNGNSIVSGPNFVFTPNQNQNSGFNNLVVSPVSPVSYSTSSQVAGLNCNPEPPSPQLSKSLNLVAAGPPNVNVVSSGLNVVSSPNSGVKYGPLNLVSLNTNCAPSQSQSSGCSSLYPANIISSEKGYSEGQNIECLTCSQGNNNAVSSSLNSNPGVAPQLSLNIQPSSQSCLSNNQAGSNSEPPSQTTLNVASSSQNSNKPKYTLTNLRPLNSGSNINLKSISFQPNCNTPLQIPSTLPSATPCSSAQCNQQSLNIGVSAFQQDLTNLSPPTYNVNVSPCAQNPPQVSITPTVNFQPISNTYSQQSASQISSPINQFPTQNVNIIQQQSTNSGSSCNTPVANPSVNFGQFSIQSPVSSNVSPVSCLEGQAPLQIQNFNSVASSCHSQNLQNTQSGPSFNLVLDEQMLSQLLSSVASNVPSIQSSSCNTQVSAPQLNKFVQSSPESITTIYSNNGCDYNNIGSYINNCGPSQSVGSVIRNPTNNQVSNSIYNLYNQQNPYSSLGSQASAPFLEYSNTLSSLPTVYTSNLASPSNSYIPSLSPSSILSAYYSKSPTSSISFDSIVSALSSPTITTDEITSLVSSLAESVLQQCNSLSSSSSARSQSNLNALPISVTTTPVESSYLSPAYSNQCVPQQQSLSCTSTQANIPIKVSISDNPYSPSDAPYNSGQSLYSSNVQPYYSIQPSTYQPVIAGSERSYSSNTGIKDIVKILVLSELFNGGYGGGSVGCGGGGLDDGLLALLLATAA